MVRTRRLCLIFCAVLGVSCTTPLERGDAARAREDWDAAVTSYEEALRGTREPQEIEAIKARLSEARDRAADLHLAQAERSEVLRDRSAALEHLERAYQLRPTEEVRQRLQRGQAAEGEACLRDGREALAQGRLADAIRLLERAELLAPSAEAAELLGKAQAEDLRLRSIEYERRVAQGRLAVECRDWGRACGEFELARRALARDDAVREEQFARLMAEGEAYAARGGATSSGRANALFLQARGYGLDAVHVDARIAATEVVDYVVTLHGAVILPGKPVTGAPWDGVGRGADMTRLADALALLAAADPVTTSAATALGALFSKGVSAPDCFAIVTFDGRSFGGAVTTDQDDYVPQWNVEFVVPSATIGDARVVTIMVRDRDLEDHDNVGVVHLTVGEIVERATKGRLRFFDDNGRLHADGIVELDISVERRPGGFGS